MFILRWVIGRIILFFNFIFSPRSPKLTPSEQAKIAEATNNLSLYQLPACPFCVKVRRSMKRNGITLPLLNINKSDEANQALIEQGGKRKVPCLRIEHENNSVEWLYESNDIIDYLTNRVRTSTINAE
ncbi:glutaredoxin [Thalassotalea sp. 1_MG-2023]|uniref:glutaredoxin family protein n=1 Tax=Thalassotalea sp. 1_MG-2023 TaxID=3062680 RepID=UPI0026E230BF|nr:glutaredoxin [Thalassotalea sp. 1_MG-2023]MDO6428712.1 glutaredoxin [Thalassotalea sp. 1_MG-2023]